MRARPLRRIMGISAVALLVAASAGDVALGNARRTSQIGVFTTGHDAYVDAVLAGVHEGFRMAGMDVDVLEKTAAGDASVARATVKEFAFEGVTVVFALGPDAARLARDALRETSVVFAAVSYPEDLGLPGRGNVCGVAGGVSAEQIVETVRRTAPSTERLGILGAPGMETTALIGRIERAAEDSGIEIVHLDPAAAGAQAGRCGAVWIAPEIANRAVDALARTLENSRVALVGSTRTQLDAGCSVVLRTDPATQGLQAAALARRVLAGEVPQQVGVRRVHRVLLEINLDAARRLGHEIPLPVLAAADHLSPAFGRRR